MTRTLTTLTLNTPKAIIDEVSEEAEEHGMTLAVFVSEIVTAVAIAAVSRNEASIYERIDWKAVKRAITKADAD